MLIALGTFRGIPAHAEVPDDAVLDGTFVAPDGFAGDRAMQPSQPYTIDRGNGMIEIEYARRVPVIAVAVGPLVTHPGYSLMRYVSDLGERQ